jgi:hypothetical protein
MHHRISAVCLTACLLAISPAAFAGPAIEKESIGPVPTESNLTRDQALQMLVEGERLLEQELVAEALAKMLEAYIALEQTDGPEASGVKELRSWLVKALETLGLPDEAGVMRARGSYVEHPLSIMPSTWFPQANPTAPMSADEAVKAIEDGFAMLEQGNVEGLAKVLTAYEIVERDQGAESEGAIAIRSFLVGLLDTGGFTDEANTMRARGSVIPSTQEDIDLYTAIWAAILQAEQAGASPFSTPTDTATTPVEPTPEPIPEPEPEPAPKKVEKGSVIPSVLIDLGIGTFQPDYGRKGFIWSGGLELHWTLFRAKWFGMQLGGGGQFGRNRDKRWQADAHGELRLLFDFEKVYIRPEFGGGYDQLAGGRMAIADAYHVAPAGYYHFGGTLGVRFAKRFGLYGRAVRLNRGDTVMPNETRVRGGFLIEIEKAAIDMAFVFTDYDPRGNAPGARIFSGNLGFRF